MKGQVDSDTMGHRQSQTVKQTSEGQVDSDTTGHRQTQTAKQI